MSYRFEICRDRGGQFRVRFVAPHGQAVFTTQPIADKAAAQSMATAIQIHAADAEAVDLTSVSAPRRYARRHGVATHQA